MENLRAKTKNEKNKVPDRLQLQKQEMWMMSPSQHIESVGKFTLTGKWSAQLGKEARFTTLKSIPPSRDQVTKDLIFVFDFISWAIC